MEQFKRLYKQFEKRDIVFAVLFLTVLGISIWKCTYGFGGYDEQFYLTIPYRLSMGDGLFGDEWHLSQMSSFLLYPIFKIYMLFVGNSTEGIIINFRYIYLFFHSLLSIALYIILRKKGTASIPAVLVFYLFAPFNIMALSYNSMGLGLLFLIGSVLTVYDINNKKLQIFLGVAFAAAVLCNPLLSVLFFLYAIAVFAFEILRKKGRNINCDYLKFGTLKYIFFGIAGLAILFLIFVFSKTTVSEFIANFPNLFTDPDHQNVSFIDKMVLYIKSLFIHGGIMLGSTGISETVPRCAFIVYLISMLAAVFDKKRIDHRIYYILLQTVIVVVYLAGYARTLTMNFFHAIMLPMALLGLTAYVFSKHKDKKMFVFMWLNGIIYSVLLNTTSNQEFFILSIAYVISIAAGMFFIKDLCCELLEEKSTLRITASLLLVGAVMLFFGYEAYVKINHTYWDERSSTLEYELTKGPAKGIKTSPMYGEDYDAVYDDLQEYRDKDTKEPIFFATYRTWAYLCVEDMPYATFSAWLSGETDETMSRLLAYYELHPEKMPKYVYILKSSGWNHETWYKFAVENGYNVTESEIAYKLEKI